MKTNYFVLCAAALAMFAACQKEENANPKVPLTASLEQQIDNSATKTALGTENTVVWSENDVIKVHGESGVEELSLLSGAGTTTGVFGETEVSNPDYAIYPASAYSGISGSTITFTLPATQTYVPNSFGNGANVAVAKIDGNNMAFKNVCGALKLQLKGSMKVKKIELTGKSGEKLNGAFTVVANADPFIGAVKSGEPTDAEKTITLDCSHFGESAANAADGGVQLDFETATNFCIIVPVSALGNGFDATIYDVAGDTFKTTLSSTGDNTVERSVITKMSSKAVSLLPAEYQEVQYIESDGRQRINTGYYAQPGTNIIFDCTLTNVQPQRRFFGSNQEGVTALTYINSSKNLGFSFGNTYSFTSCKYALSNNERIVIELKAGALRANGVIVATGPRAISDTDTVCIYLFGLDPTVSNMSGIIGYLHGSKIYTGTTLERYFVPCYKKADNEIGAYDLVTKEFYGNAGSGSFTKGADI